MLNIVLDEELAAALSRLARRQKKSRAELARAAIEKFIEDAEDYRDVLAERKRRSRGLSLDEIKKRHGLDS